jgi:hypothetical protein
VGAEAFMKIDFAPLPSGITFALLKKEKPV